MTVKNSIQMQKYTAITYTNLNSIAEDLLVGDTVFHQKFGYGTIKILKAIMLKSHFLKPILKS